MSLGQNIVREGEFDIPLGQKNFLLFFDSFTLKSC